MHLSDEEYLVQNTHLADNPSNGFRIHQIWQTILGSEYTFGGIRQLDIQNTDLVDHIILLVMASKYRFGR